MYYPWYPPPQMGGGNSGSSLDDLIKFTEFAKKMEEDNKKKHEVKHDKKVARTFGFIEMLIMTCFLSIPVGLFTSYFAVVLAKYYVESLQTLLK